MLFSRAVLATVAVVGATAAPSYDMSSVSAATPLYNWISTSLSQLVASTSSLAEETSEYVATSSPSSSLEFKPFGEKPDFPDKTIWEVIQENEYLTDLKKVLKYAGPGAREMLDDKDKKLTFLIPTNWNKKEDHDINAVMQWQPIQAKIDELEADELTVSSSKEDDGRKEMRKKAIQYLIDQTIKYHIVDSDALLTAKEIAQNSSVATTLNIGKGKAKEVFGNLLDGEQFRVRVGKSLLPLPSVYFNFYSRLVYSDVNIGGSLVHAISYPLAIPPSSLQNLFFGQSVFSTLTSSLQKVHVDGYFKLPINMSAIPHHHREDHKQHSLMFKDEPSHHHHHHHGAPGQGSTTLFAPANLAWTRIPLRIKLYLFSPFGQRSLMYLLALHSLPNTIFYADFVHEAKGGKLAPAKQYTVDAASIRSATGDLTVAGKGNVTEYEFATACPKLHFNHTSEAWTESKME